MKLIKLLFLLLLNSNLFAQAAPSESSLTTYLTGDAADVSTNTRSGFLLAGGSTDVDEAMLWMLERSGGGDVVVIRSSGADGYNPYLFKLAVVNSVQTFIINSREKAFLPEVATAIRNAEMLFIAGGDQWNYVRYWKNSPVEDAIQYLIETKKVPVGGTSAGCAILGDSYFAAQFGTIQSDEALTSPFHVQNTIGKSDFLTIPALKYTITDSHFSQRNRQGRLVSWMASLKMSNNTPVYGIGVDEKTAIAIDETGWATVFGTNEAFFMQAGKAKPSVFEPGEPLQWTNKHHAVEAYIIKGNSTGNGNINLYNWKKRSGGRISFYEVEQGKLKSF